jgi:hypothetical protein
MESVGKPGTLHEDGLIDERNLITPRYGVYRFDSWSGHETTSVIGEQKAKISEPAARLAK